MEFGWINLFGAAIVILILVPNIVYAIKRRSNSKPEANVPKALVIIEQIGRYSCIVLMWLPLLVWKFGFASSMGFIMYLAVNLTLLIAYYIFWILYFKQKTLAFGLALAIIPTVLFLSSGLLLRHWCLAAAAVVFGFSHIYITVITHKNT